MSKSKISQMSLEEIFKKIGDSIVMEQVQYVVKDIEKLNLQECNPENVVDYIKNHEDNIDKEKLVLCIACNMEEVRKKFETTKSNKIVSGAAQWVEKCCKKAKEVLEGANVEIPSIVMEKGYIQIRDFYTADEFLGRKREDTALKQKNAEILQEAEKDGILGEILSNIFSQDFKECLCYYGGNGQFFNYIVQENYTRASYNFFAKEKCAGKEYSESETDKINEQLFIKELMNVLKRYCDKIDMEKVMLLSAYRSKRLLTDHFREMSLEETKEYSRIMEYVSQKINPKLKMNGKVFKLFEDGEEYMQYSAKELMDDVQRIVTTKRGVRAYFPKQELLDAKSFVLQGERTLDQMIEIGIFPLLRFSSAEKQELIQKNPENFDLLVSMKALNQEEIRKALENVGEYKIESVDALYENGLIDKTDLVAMYRRNQIDLGKILAYEDVCDLKEEIKVEELMRCYANMKQDEDKTKDFDRYALLFREIKLKGQKPEVQAELAEQIVEKIYEMDSEYVEDFKSLYQSDLLPIRTLIDWNGEDMIYDLIAHQELKPRDAKDLLMTQELDLKRTYKTLQTSNWSNEEKMNFIFSSFDGTGNSEEEIKAQNDARMYLIQAIRISKDIVYEKEGNEIRERKGMTQSMKRNQYVTDPVYRWQLFSQMDEGCTSKVYLDGTIAFTLPNINNGMVVIEKMYKSTKSGTKINYGSATYVMSQEEFLNHKSEIEEDGKINRKMLREMQKTQKADKIIHSTGWGQGLKKNLGLSIEEGYTQEKVAKIDGLIERIEQTKELIR